MKIFSMVSICMVSFFMNTTLTNAQWTSHTSGTELRTVSSTAQYGWGIQNSGVNRNLYGVYFTDSLTGTAVGDSGTILHTTNGGTTWNTQSSGVLYHLNDVNFIHRDTGVVVGRARWIPDFCYGAILRTTNGGTSWTDLYPDSLFWPSVGALRAISFPSATLGYTVGGQMTYYCPTSYEISYIHRTTDGGATWNHQSPSLICETMLEDVHFPTESIGFVVGTNGAIYKTTDSGQNWISQSSGTTKVLHSVHFTES